MKKRILSLVLSLCLAAGLMSVVSLSAAAAGGDSIEYDPNASSSPAPIVVPTYSVTVEASGRGSVKSSHARAYGGSTITLTPAAETGNGLISLTAEGTNNQSITLTDKENGTYTFTMPHCNVTVKAVFSDWDNSFLSCPRDHTCPISNFSDLDPNAWYHDSMHFCLLNSLLQGTGGNRFSPDMLASRSQFVTLLWRLAGEPVVDSALTFTDVPEGTWYTEAVRWAASTGLVTGYSETRFGPDDPISREQMAVLLWRYAGSPAAAQETLDFPDADQVSTWALDALLWANEKGIVNGRGSVLAPKDNATRVEMSQMLRKFILSQY